MHSAWANSEGLRMWTECLERAAARADVGSDWVGEAVEAQRTAARC